MPLKVINGLVLRTVEQVSTTDGTIAISGADAAKLNQMAIGDYCYLSLQWNDAYEIVKYTHTGALAITGAVRIPVLRDVESTGRKSFPIGTCLYADWNTIQLCEFVRGCVGG